MVSKGIVEKKTVLKKKHSDCFVISEGIDTIETWNSKQNSFPKITSEEIQSNLQLFIDIGVIENASNPEKNISDDDEIFKFTSQVFAKEINNEEFVKKMSDRFSKFKIVHSLVNNAIFVKKFYDKAFCSKEFGISIRNRINKFRILKNVFSGTESIDWLLKNYPDLKLDRFGAAVLFESLRQLRIFDSVNCDSAFKDQSEFYTLRDEVQFLAKLLDVYNSQKQSEVKSKNKFNIEDF